MLAGDVSVLAQARRALAHSSAATNALNEWGEVVDALVGSGLGPRMAIDLGEVRGLDYYTGLVFRAYARGLGFEVGSGGRYDSLLARFGRPLPAVGFMLGLDRLALLLERQGPLEAWPEGDAEVVEEGSLSASLIQARALRAQGRRVRLQETR
jgi:ATP phosphoribosyltransferase regulatory subunit